MLFLWHPVFARTVVWAVLVLSLTTGGTFAQKSPAVTAPDPAKSAAAAEFAAAADEVLAQMSEITGLKLRTPVKKTLRSREEIRAYVINEMNEDKQPAERYASARSAEAFGLLPKGFDIDSFMIELLTEQIAGLYDPKAHEFYIADWIPLADQKMVMAHELTHALEDQHFQIETWAKAARPNDDGELAREAVLEGSAMAAMIDYLLNESGRSLKDLPDIDPGMLVGDMGSTPGLKKAPPFLKDALVFPYFAGLTFSADLLKNSGWKDLPEVFSKPPISTQQVMHPALYRAGKTPATEHLPDVGKLLGPDWTMLEENIMGEFGWKEVLKQFLGENRAKALAAAWDGDRYVVYEHKRTKRLVLVSLLRLNNAAEAVRFFGQYSEALEKKYDERSKLFRRPNFFSFDSIEGGVYLRCLEAECLSVEGTTRVVLDGVTKAIGWPASPEPPLDPAKPGGITVTSLPNCELDRAGGSGFAQRQ
ncbi:MAG: hypothetical protein QOG55_387 [Acidobacteriaceae bacterium]|jgi:hypothetical protein|nr:hypothetical protein [Acidobacteriaceae bacterium]